VLCEYGEDLRQIEEYGYFLSDFKDFKRSDDDEVQNKDYCNTKPSPRHSEKKRGMYVFFFSQACI
jgi:hypothetical protein